MEEENLKLEKREKRMQTCHGQNNIPEYTGKTDFYYLIRQKKLTDFVSKIF